jgi:hypothetical protein
VFVGSIKDVIKMWLKSSSTFFNSILRESYESSNHFNLI